MSHSHQPSGLRGGIEFLIDPGWSPEQAFAVVELLDDLRNRIIGKQRQRLARCRFALDRLAHHNQATRRRPAGCLVTKFRQFHSAFQRPPAAGLVDRPL